MTDQDYLLIQCPNGHDLQAARDDLSKKLACPVCDTHFVPAETGNMGGESTPPTVVPQTISNASFQVPDYPGTTEPLRYIWLYFYLVLFALNVFSLISKSELVTPGQTPGPLVFLVSCSFLLAFAAGWIIHLIWLYRIHADANKHGDYKSIPAWLAVVVAIVPIINVIWSAIIMWMLAKFSDKRNAAQGNDGTAKPSSAVGITASLLVVTLIWLGVSGVFGYKSYGFTQQAKQTLTEQKDLKLGTPDYQRALAREIRTLTPPWMLYGAAIIPLMLGIPYFFAVRNLVDSLYPALGAPLRE